MSAVQRRAALWAVMALAALAYAAFIWRTSFRIAGITYFTLVDDAMVSMRYAQHLARGPGMIWNIGQPPVQGFTNPGWMLLMALLHLLPLPAANISLAVMLLAALLLLANVAVVFGTCEALSPASKAAPLAAAALTAFYFPLVFWSLRGMEVGLLVLLIDSAVLLVISSGPEPRGRRAVALGMLLAAAVLVRLDAAIQAGIVLAYLALAIPDRRRLVLPAALVAATLAAVLLFQRLYFGDWLPNTYYQKMAGTAAVERIRYGLLAFYGHAMWDTVLPAILAGAALVRYRALRRPETWLLTALFAAQCAYSVWVGGDYAEVEVDAANRFITQGMPALIILFALAAERLAADARLHLPPKAARAAALGLALLTLLVMSGRPWRAWAADNAPLLKADIRRVRLGLFLKRNTLPQAVIAVHAAGQIPYYSERTTVDLLGLNDRVVAHGPLSGPFYPGHDKWYYAYSIGQLKPDVIADNWIRLAAYMKGNEAYLRLDNGIYVRRDSTLVDRAGLAREYRQGGE